MDPCSVGEQLQDSSECHKTCITRMTGLKTLKELPQDHVLLLQLRTSVMTLSQHDTICLHHEKLYIDRYKHMQKACCDPFNVHKKPVKKSLKVITLDDAIYLSARFGSQFVPGWKLCPRCSQHTSGYSEGDTEEHRRKPSDGRAAKALKSLQFANPGRQTEFTPETSKREKRRQQTKSTTGSTDRQILPSKNKVYDSNGILLSNGRDLCDCLDENCLGCFYECKKCGSHKCGVECRCDRKWFYEQIEVEGGEVIRNKNAS
ncbi:ARL14 effector protein [Spea bombifrons]|uniref:ARL14 effector protein n=1 Tax=Spea bombifrons TaxID=233779 RepID=UPI00234B69EE|nr:ARL14 effector protein [Spea bombifrons]